jgi:hypothetical protein
MFREENKKINLYEFDFVKNRVVQKDLQSEFMTSFNQKFVYCGTYNKKWNFPKMIYHSVQQLPFKDAYSIFQAKEMELLHKRLEKSLEMITHPQDVDYLIFKAELDNRIHNYQVKELYLHESCKDLLKNYPTDCLNFEIIVVKSLSKNDVADVFLNKYSGVLGIAYYIP